MGVPVRNSTRSQCSAHAETVLERSVSGFFTKCASSTTSMPSSPPPGTGNPRRASKVVTATPPRPFQSANASRRSGPCSGVTRNALRFSISRVQLISTLAGQTTRKWLCPSPTRCASAAMAWMVLPSPISSPRIVLRWASAKRVPKAWYPRSETRRCVSSSGWVLTRSATSSGRNPSAAAGSGARPETSASRP